MNVKYNRLIIQAVRLDTGVCLQIISQPPEIRSHVCNGRSNKTHTITLYSASNPALECNSDGGVRFYLRGTDKSMDTRVTSSNFKTPEDAIEFLQELQAFITIINKDLGLTDTTPLPDTQEYDYYLIG